MNYADRVNCPGCEDYIPADLLCEHDNTDTGPLCIGRCCPHWHDGSEAA